MGTTALVAVGFEFLRPMWLLALLLLPVIYWLARRRHDDQDAWQRAVDPHLLPHLLQIGGARRARGGSVLLMVGAVLAVLALAGPSWHQQTTPLWQVQSPLVVALDLSSAMTAADLPPSRLMQARFKLTELLKQRRGGQVGLLVYAGDAFTVAPITRDARTVQALLDSLDTQLMPVDGQRADRAIERALTMLQSAGFVVGDILLLSDHADAAARTAAAAARAAGFRVSALGLGTAGGAPVAGKQGFVTGPDGQVQLARLDASSLSALATDGGGAYSDLTQDDADLAALDLLDPQARAQDAASLAITPGAAGNAGVSVQRSDDGIWLVLLLLPLILLGFRRGWLMLLPFLVLGVMMPMRPLLAAPASGTASATPESAAAHSGSGDWSWSALWQRADQRAHRALQAGEVDAARALAKDPALQGAAAYRGNDYAAAAKDWSAIDNADAKYNRGNALAMAGKYQDALKAYDEALQRAPGMPDAVANRKAIEDLLKQQQAQQQGQQKDGGGEQQEGDSAKSQQQKGADGQSNPPSRDASQPGEKNDASAAQQSGDQAGDAASKPSGKPEDKPAGDKQQPGDAGKPQQGEDDKSSPASSAADDQHKQDAEGHDEPAPSAADAAGEQQAKDAAKRAMEQALKEGGQTPADGQQGSSSASGEARAPTPEERDQLERQQALQQWMRRVPDDPGGLLRRKFALEYQRRQSEGNQP